MLGIGTELTFGDDEGDLIEAIRESAQQSTSRAVQRLVEGTLDIQPIITVRPGWPILQRTFLKLPLTLNAQTRTNITDIKPVLT